MAKNKTPMTGASYNLTLDLKSWVEKQAEIRGISASDVIREILKKEKKQDEEKVS